ncbi:MAG: O-antigen translocase [Deltaproteobacteria bacterium]|nr:O-antigen translocase [Candidatus Deferrimicrobium borealis]
MPQTAETATAEKHTYGQILKSSALIGGSSAVTILFGIIRTKAMAVLLGPAGFGLMSVYGSIADLAQSIAGMGINSSGVRQIAEAVGTGEQERIARTAAVLRWTSVFLGIVGAIFLVLFSAQVSILTFGGNQRSAAVALLSLAVFFRLVSAGQGALIQGMRRISDLARMGILGGLFGTVISIVLVYFLRERGIVPALVGIALAALITSWWYSRKVEIERPSMTLSLVRQEAPGLLKLGFAFMVSGCLMMGAGYAVRTMVLRMVGLEAAGFYSAAWTLGGLYVGFILQAMGADFYPRLTAVARDNAECNRLVNEQAQISLLLAGPGVIATLTFAPVVIALFYSAKFNATVEILRWICLGMTLRVITWPMGFIILAKGASNYLIWTEIAWTVVNVGLSWVCLKSFGLNGVGIAFFGSYVFHGLMIYPIVRRLSGFRWSSANRKTGLLCLTLVAVVFCGFYILSPLFAVGLGILAVILISAYSIRILFNLVPSDRIPNPLRRWLARFGLTTSGS